MFRNVIIPQASPAMPPRIPPPSHRHGTPSGPWPFLDIDDEVDPNRIQNPDSHLPLSARPCEHVKTPTQEVCWCKYPQSLFPNWTSRQQKKSRITKVIERSGGESSIYYLDVMKDGTFVDAGVREVDSTTLDIHWLAIKHGRPPGVRVRALFVECLSGPVLQMLGTRYNIEPFFFSSSIGWIPSRYQSNVISDHSDHITITLTFIRTIQNPTTVPPSPTSSYTASTISRIAHQTPDLVIDTQAPLPLRSSGLLLLPDLLALHIIRKPQSGSSTIISYHPGEDHRTTTASGLHDRVQSTGRSVYWSNIFRDESDPTFVLLSLLWYALYAWDEALEKLYNHICHLESKVMTTNDIELIQELHVVRAHLLHYESLLDNFRKTVVFILDTPYPESGQRHASSSPSQRSGAEVQHLKEEKGQCLEEQKRSGALMRKECGNLLSEIQRLESSRESQDHRLKNVMDLSFSIINIEDSRRMAKLTEAAVRDSAAMKQIAYLTMVFLPASFVAAAFGMNIVEINPQGSTAHLSQYVAFALPLTAITIWIIVAFQIQIKTRRTRPRSSSLSMKRNRVNTDEPRDEEADGNKTAMDDDWTSRYSYYGYGGGGDAETIRKLDMWARLWWPVVLFSTIFESRRWKKERREA